MIHHAHNTLQRRMIDYSHYSSFSLLDPAVNGHFTASVCCSFFKLLSNKTLCIYLFCFFVFLSINSIWKQPVFLFQMIVWNCFSPFSIVICMAQNCLWICGWHHNKYKFIYSKHVHTACACFHFWIWLSWMYIRNCYPSSNKYLCSWFLKLPFVRCFR